MSVSNNSSLIWDAVFYLLHRLLLDHLQLRLEVVLEASVMYKYPTMSLIGESKEIKHPHTETVKCNCSSEIHRGEFRKELRNFSDIERPWNLLLRFFRTWSSRATRNSDIHRGSLLNHWKKSQIPKRSLDSEDLKHIGKRKSSRENEFYRRTPATVAPALSFSSFPRRETLSGIFGDPEIHCVIFFKRVPLERQETPSSVVEDFESSRSSARQHRPKYLLPELDRGWISADVPRITQHNS